MEGQLLATARPYLQIFSLFTLMPPPSIYGRSSNSKCSWRHLLIFVFGLYTCCVFVLALYVNFVNIIVLDMEIKLLGVEDFTSKLGQLQKFFYTILVAIIHAYMLIYFGRLRGIYVEIAAIEQDIDVASQCLGRQRKRYCFRKRLAFVVGLWLISLFTAFPRITIPALTTMMHWRDKMFTEFIMLIMQLKIVEYTLYVLLVQELLIRLRHLLTDLKRKLTMCEREFMLQALCSALRRNKQLLSRVWKLVGELEAYFMLPMLVLFLYNGISMLHIINWVYIQAVSASDCENCRFWRVSNSIFLLINLLIPCWISTNCIGTYNSFKRIIHNIRCGSEKVIPPMLKHALREYILQLEHLKLRFTCGSFFNINLKCFGSMVVTITSFAIILIQFKLQGFVQQKDK